MNKKLWVVYQCSKCGMESTAKPELNLTCNCKEKGKMYPIGFDNEEIPKIVRKFFKEKNIIEKFVEQLDKRIAGETFLKKSLIIQILGGRLVINSDPTSSNVLLQSVSGGGKDWIAKNIIKLLPDSYVEHRTRISDRALNYWHPAIKEPEYTWNGRVVYLEDINNRILNSEVLKVMMSGGSNASIVHDGELVDLEIRGKPVFIFTGAFVEPSIESDRRVMLHTLTEDEHQTELILDLQSQIAAEGLPKYDDNLRHFNYCLRRVNVAVPFSSNIGKRFPHNILARTSYGQFIDLIRFSAAINQHNRKLNKKGEVIAQEEDYENARELFEGLFSDQKGLERLTKNHKILLKYFQELRGREVSATQVNREIGHRLYTQINNLIKALNSLAQKGLLKIGEGEQNNRSIDVYSFSEQDSEFKLPSFNELIKVSKVSKVNKVREVSKISKEDKIEVTQLTPFTEHISPKQEIDSELDEVFKDG